VLSLKRFMAGFLDLTPSARRAIRTITARLTRPHDHARICYACLANSSGTWPDWVEIEPANTRSNKAHSGIFERFSLELTCVSL
jgi:hypothetical protein